MIDFQLLNWTVSTVAGIRNDATGWWTSCESLRIEFYISFVWFFLLDYFPTSFRTVIYSMFSRVRCNLNFFFFIIKRRIVVVLSKIFIPNVISQKYAFNSRRNAGDVVPARVWKGLSRFPFEIPGWNRPRHAARTTVVWCRGAHSWIFLANIFRHRISLNSNWNYYI